MGNLNQNKSDSVIYSEQFRVYIDMDKTLCDFESAFNREKSLITWPQSKIGFFSGLEPMQDAIESYKYLDSRYDVCILSRPSFQNLNSYSEKAEWVKKYLGFEAQKKLILCGDKSRVIGHVLVDDHDADGQPNFQGLWLRFGTSECPDWKTAVIKIDEFAQRWIKDQIS